MRFDLFNTLVEKHLQMPCYRQVDLLVTCALTNHIVIDFPNPYNYFVYMDNDEHINKFMKWVKSQALQIRYNNMEKDFVK